MPLFSQSPYDPHKPRPIPRKSDGTYDEPYNGLEHEYERETLSQSELKRLRFIRWSRRHKKPQYSEYPPED